MSEHDEALSPEEMAVVEAFRQRMANPEQGEMVTVQNESLGQLLDGTKLQFRPGDGKTYQPAPQGAERFRQREQRRQEAREAAQRRAARGKQEPLVVKVDKAIERLKGANVADTIAYIKDLPQKEQEVYILAEIEGENRVSVVRSFPKLGAKVQEQYRKEREVYNELSAE